MFFDKKFKKRMTLEDNKSRGKLTEDLFVLSETAKGNEVRRTGRGSDFEVIRRDPLTGRSKGKMLYEIKSGNARESKLQQRTKKRNKGRYSVVRSGWW